MANLKLSPPWDTFYKEVKALFGRDEEVKVVMNEEKYELNLFVDNAEKADAISKLLPVEKTFGNVTLYIRVIPADGGKERIKDIFAKAFSGNPAFSYIKSIDPSTGAFGATYVVFENRVVQFYNDDLTDVNGNCSTLYQDIAQDVITAKGVYYCTDVPR